MLAVAVAFLAFHLQALPEVLTPRLAILREAAVKGLDPSGQIPADWVQRKKQHAYKSLFEAIDKGTLATLTNDPDTSLALQSEWELCRTPVKRKTPIEGRSDWIYDPEPLSNFLAFFEKRVGFAPPSLVESCPTPSGLLSRRAAISSNRSSCCGR